MALNNLRISALLALATAAACGDSSLPSENLDAATTFGSDGGSSGPVAWPGQTGIDGGPWVPSQTCWERAVALVELLTPAQCFGQMTTVDSDGLTVSRGHLGLAGLGLQRRRLGSRSRGAISNLIPDWSAMISSYLDVAKGFEPAHRAALRHRRGPREQQRPGRGDLPAQHRARGHRATWPWSSRWGASPRSRCWAWAPTGPSPRRSRPRSTSAGAAPTKPSARTPS